MTNQNEVGSELQVLIDGDEDFDLASEGLTESFVRHWCHVALQSQTQLNIAEACTVEVSVQLVDTSAMQQLNHQYRDKDTVTNVLSFNSDMPVLPSGLMTLGDLVLCPDVIRQEAFKQGKAVTDHWAHLLVHGILHLCGYDHEHVNQAKAMESMEIQILSGSGISDPYLV